MSVTNEDVIIAIQDISTAIKQMQGEDSNGDAVTLAILQVRQSSIEKKLDSVCRGYRDDHDRLGKVESKVSNFAAVQLVLSAAFATIAGWFGSR